MSVVKVLNMLCIWVETCALIYSTRRALWAVTEFKQSSWVFVKPKPQQPVSQAEDMLWCIQIVERLLSWILEQYFTTTVTKFSCYVSVQTGPFRAYNNLDTGQKCKVTFLTRSSYYCVEVQYLSPLFPPPLQDGQTALYIASWKGHDWIVELLLRRGADANHQKKVRLPVHVSLVI